MRMVLHRSLSLVWVKWYNQIWFLSGNLCEMAIAGPHPATNCLQLTGILMVVMQPLR
jgi:hypothetical protein